MLTPVFRVRGDPRVEGGDPEQLQVRPKAEIHGACSREKVGLVGAVCRFDSPPEVVVFPQRTRFPLVHIEVGDERKPTHSDLRLEDVTSILVFGVRGQRLLDLSVGDQLRLGVEELRELLLCVIGGVADLALVLAEERHVGRSGVDLFMLMV